MGGTKCTSWCLTEFDGKGLNVGIHVPLLNSTHINLAITHFEDIGNFATEDDNYFVLCISQRFEIDGKC